MVCPSTLVYQELLSGELATGDQGVQLIIVNVNYTRFLCVHYKVHGSQHLGCIPRGRVGPSLQVRGSQGPAYAKGPTGASATSEDWAL